MYLFWGKVIQGKKRGKNLGFPTVNLRLHKKIPDGVYVSKTKIDNKWHKSVSFIGAAKTFGAVEVFGETHILDFNRDLYRKWLSIKLLKKIRGSEKFQSETKLVAKIKKDIQEAIFYFQTTKI
jgi:riboflavin kinase/FMN adenylyltransferase